MAKDGETIELATDIVVAWLANPNTRADIVEVPEMLTIVHRAIGTLAGVPATTEPEPEIVHEPAVSVRKSLASPDHIVSMIDGKPYRALTRHLRSHGLTPDDYRARFGLRADYPMVAPAYSAQRRAHAQRIGLGRSVRADARAKRSRKAAAVSGE